MAVPTFTSTGNKTATPAKLDKAIFNINEINHQLLKDVYLAYLANGRKNLAVTKTRGLVSGGGKKPWKQKGTGRARFGSSRVPIWRGGGITFGPTGQENYKRKINHKAKLEAIKQAISLANQSGSLIVIEDFINSNGKTKDSASLLKKIGATGNVVIVVDTKNESIVRSTRNLKDVKAVQAKYLNVYDILNADSVVISKKALDPLSDWLGGESK